jgi:hypothetical protein
MRLRSTCCACALRAASSSSTPGRTRRRRTVRELSGETSGGGVAARGRGFRCWGLGAGARGPPCASRERAAFVVRTRLVEYDRDVTLWVPFANARHGPATPEPARVHTVLQERLEEAIERGRAAEIERRAEAHAAKGGQAGYRQPSNAQPRTTRAAAAAAAATAAEGSDARPRTTRGGGAKRRSEGGGGEGS